MLGRGKSWVDKSLYVGEQSTIAVASHGSPLSEGREKEMVASNREGKVFKGSSFLVVSLKALFFSSKSVLGVGL